MFGFREKTGKKESFIGVNITSNVINITSIKQDGQKVIVQSFDTVELPFGLEKEKIDNFILETLKKYFSNVKSPKPKVFSLISGPDVIIRRLSLPKLHPKELLEAIKWEIKTHIPFPIENAAINYTVLGEIQTKEAPKLDLLVAIIPKDYIKKTNAIFEKAGVILKGLTIAPFAVWNLLKATSLLKKDTKTAFVDFGSENTKVVFFDGENLEFYREIPLGGMHITKSMTGLFVADKWQMNLNYSQAEELKRKFGIPDENTEEVTDEGIPLKQIYQVIRPTLRRYINEICRSFNYYKEQFSKTSIDRVIISGGGSKLKNLDAHLAAELGVKIEKIENLLSVEKGQLIKDSNELFNAIPHIAMAIGAALSQAKEMNFIGKSFGTGGLTSAESSQQRVLMPQQMGSVIILILAIVYIIAIFAFIGNLNKTINEYELKLKNQRILLMNLKMLNEKRDILAKIEAQKNYLNPPIAEISNLLPKKAYLKTLSFNNTTKQFSISGVSENMYSIGEFLKKVESSGFFSESSLSEAKKIDDKHYSFSMTFKLKI